MYKYEYKSKLTNIKCTCGTKLFELRQGGIFYIEIKCRKCKCTSAISSNGDTNSICRVKILNQDILTQNQKLITIK